MPTKPACAAPPPPWRLRAFALAGLLALGCILRAPSLLRSVLDWDESLYLLMASAWRAGHLPYTTIWDNKPPGIYVIFAAALAIFGHHIAAIRIATILAAGLTAFAVWRITFALLASLPHRLAGAWLGALTYSISALSNDGLAANTEIFMVCFTAYSLVNALGAAPPWRLGFTTGVLFACAILTKYVAIFEAPAILLALLWWQPRRNLFKHMGGAVLGGLLPLAIIIGLYAAHGQLALCWQDSVAANFTRADTQITIASLQTALSTQISRWLPLYAAPLVLLWQARRGGPQHRTRMFLLIWLAGGAIGVAAAKSFYDHYFQQILPVLSIITAVILASLANRRTLTAAFAAFIIIPALSAANAIWQITWPVLNPTHQDIPEQIATNLRAALQPGQNIYNFDDQPIIYFLTNQTPPTRYVLPSTLDTKFLARVAGVNAPAEVMRILATNPTYIITNRAQPANTPNKNQAVYDIINTALAARYHLWRGYATTDIYQINP